MREAQTDSYRETLARLASAQKKPAPGSPPYSIYVNRPIGRLIAAAAYRAGLTPNAVTGISAVFTFSGILLIASIPPSLVSGIGIWLLLAIGYACDSADGQVARLRGGGSLAGEWLDHVVDAAKIGALHTAVLIAAYRFFELPAIGLMLVPIGFLIVANVTFFAMILNDQLRGIAAAKRGVAQPSRPTVGKLRRMLLLPTDYGILCLTFALIGMPWIFFTAYTVLFLAAGGFLALASVKWFKEMSHLDVDEHSAQGAHLYPTTATVES